MRKFLFSLFFLLLQIGNIYSQVSCTPTPGGAGEGCANPCWVCFNPYLGNTLNFQGSGIQPSSGFCGANTFLHNDQFLLFKPTCFGTGAVTFNISTNNGCSIQTAIYEVTGSCSSQVTLECNPGFSGEITGFGSAVNYKTGKNYMLVIDGVSGSPCRFFIQVENPSCIENPPNPFTEKWSETGLMSGNASIDCPGKYATYSLPLNASATEYNWKVEEGDAVIQNDHGVEFTDNNVGKPGTDVKIIGSKRNSIRLKFTGKCPSQKTVLLSCEGTDNCYSLGKTNYTITVNCPPDLEKHAKLCPNQSSWTDTNPYIGGPYLPSDTCGAERLYSYSLINQVGCPYNVKVGVTRFCYADFYKGLETIVLCKGDSVEIENQYFKSNAGYQELIIAAQPAQNANLNPPLCDRYIHFSIEEFDFDVKINNSDVIEFPCQKSKIFLSADIALDANLNSLGKLTYAYQWERFEGGEWKPVSSANNSYYFAEQAGKYRFKVVGTLSYDNGIGETKQAVCTKISKEITVKESSILADTNMVVSMPILQNVDGLKGCEGLKSLYSIINSDTTLNYYATVSGGAVTDITKDKISVNWEKSGGQLLFIQAVKVENGKCAVTDTIYTVFVNQTPKVSCMAPRTQCGLTSRLAASTDLGTGKWRVIDKPIGSTVTISEETSPITFCKVSEVGVYKIRWEATNDGCTAACETALTFIKKPPTIESLQYSCNKAKSNYTIAMKLSGKPPFRIMKNSTKGILIGSTYISYPIANGSAYSVKIMDADNCDTLIKSGIYVCPGISPRQSVESSDEPMMTLYPNPAQDKVTLSWNKASEEPIQIELWDMTGRLIQKQIISGASMSHEMDVRGVPSGNYVVQLVYKDRVLRNKMMVIKN